MMMSALTNGAQVMMERTGRESITPNPKSQIPNPKSQRQIPTQVSDPNAHRSIRLNVAIGLGFGIWGLGFGISS
jgi:hypothetical protein